MAVALSSSSPTNLSKGSTISMESPPLISPSSDKRFWSAFGSRVDMILEDRKRKSISSGAGESESETRFKEDAQILLRGFDSIGFSLAQLTGNLDAVQQAASDLARPSLTELWHRGAESKEEEEELQPRAKKQCASHESSINNDDFHPKSNNDDDNKVAAQDETRDSPESTVKGEKMKKARNLAVSMATKAASLVRELKTVKSDLFFMQERCALLEEENRRLRDGFAKGVRPEEDDLVRLQLEALLTEKSRLANVNANLTRENQCLHQLVEYHQLTSQDLSASYEQAIRGICLDFSSPEKAENDGGYNDYFVRDDTHTPHTAIFGLAPVEEYSEKQEHRNSANEYSEEEEP